MARIDLPILTSWLRKQSNGGDDQVDAFLGSLDRAQLERLDATMRELARAVRAWCLADTALTAYTQAAAAARSLANEQEHADAS